jgi:hypothetical protein
MAHTTHSAHPKLQRSQKNPASTVTFRDLKMRASAGRQLKKAERLVRVAQIKKIASRMRWKRKQLVKSLASPLVRNNMQIVTKVLVRIWLPTGCERGLQKCNEEASAADRTRGSGMRAPLRPLASKGCVTNTIARKERTFVRYTARPATDVSLR